MAQVKPEPAKVAAPPVLDEGDEPPEAISLDVMALDVPALAEGALALPALEVTALPAVLPEAGALLVAGAAFEVVDAAVVDAAVLDAAVLLSLPHALSVNTPAASTAIRLVVRAFFTHFLQVVIAISADLPFEPQQTAASQSGGEVGR